MKGGCASVGRQGKRGATDFPEKFLHFFCLEKERRGTVQQGSSHKDDRQKG